MKQLIFILSAALFVASTPLSAGESDTRASGKRYTPAPMEPETKGGLYVAIFGGINAAQTADVDEIDGGILGNLDTELESDIGGFAGLKFGYVFPTRSILKPVLEIEGFYTGVEAQFETDTDLGDFDVSADFHSAVFMVNAIVKFDLGRFQPYLGGGVGYAHTWIDQVELDDEEIDDAEDEEGSFAFQGLAGMEYHVTDRIGIFTEYKALVLHEVGEVRNYVNHLIGVGLRIGF